MKNMLRAGIVRPRRWVEEEIRKRQEKITRRFKKPEESDSETPPETPTSRQNPHTHA